MTRLIATLRHWLRILRGKDQPDYQRVDSYTSRYYK